MGSGGQVGRAGSDERCGVRRSGLTGVRVRGGASGSVGRLGVAMLVRSVARLAGLGDKPPFYIYRSAFFLLCGSCLLPSLTQPAM
jgi:hypothetical protein